MKLLQSFNDYQENIILESIANGTLPLILSPNLMVILDEIKHPIAKRLLKDSEMEEKKQTLLDVIPNEVDKLYFVTANKIINDKDFNEDDYPYITSYLINNEKSLSYKFKSKIRIGRLINKLYPNEFLPNGVLGKDIESFMNEYSTILQIDYDLFDIVDGDEIKDWYHEENYYWEEDSTLNQSCMRYNSCQKYIDFYAMNPNSVQLIILYNNNKKNEIQGRALLWKLAEINETSVSNTYFMDRVYFNKQIHLNKFIAFAESKGYLYKRSQNSDYNEIIYNLKNKESERVNLEVHNMNYPKHLKFPFLDTLYNYNPFDGILRNFNGHHKKFSALEDTSGYSNIKYSKRYDEVLMQVNNDNWVIDAIDDDYIRREDAIYLEYYSYFVHPDNLKEKFVKSKYHNSYIRKHFARYVINYKDWISERSLNDANLWVYNDFIDEYIKKEDAIYSDRLDTYVYKEDAIKIYKDAKKHKFMISIEDDPMEDFFKYKGDYFFNEIEKEDIDNY